MTNPMRMRLFPALAAAVSLVSVLALASCLSLGGPSPQPSPLPSPSPSPAPKDIYSLVASGDMEGLKAILKSREIVNSPDSRGDYPLHVAVQRGEVPIVEYLVAMGANLESKDRLGRTPLKLAVDLGKDLPAQALAAKGASIFAPDAAGADPADAALRKGPAALQVILNRSNIDSQDGAGRTILHRAARAGLLDAVRVALTFNPDINKKDAEGKTPLDEAYLRPHVVESARIAEALVQRGGASFLDEFSWFSRCARDGEYNSRRFDDGNSPLHEAVMRNQRGFVQFLVEKRVDLNAKNAAGNAPLHDAVRSGYTEAARLLLASGADPNVRDLFDNTPIHLDMPKDRRAELIELLISYRANLDAKDRNGNAPLHIACLLAYPAAEAELMLKAGARVDAANSDGNTPLHLAVQKDNPGLIRLLLAWKANMFALNGKKESPLLLAFRKGRATTSLIVGPDTVNIRDDSGNTPLMLAVRTQDQKEVLALLIEAGAEINARSNSGDTALHAAVSLDKRELGELLLAAGADVFAANMLGELPITLAMRDSQRPVEWIFTDQTIRARDGAGNTALHYAARLDLARLIPILARRGAEIDPRNGNGETPLHAAVKADAAESVKALTALKASLTARDALGNTPLHVAVQWGAAKSIALVSQSREALGTRNLSGKTALHEAARKENMTFLQLLLERGADPNARDGAGATPLMESIQAGKLEVARLLVQKAGAKPGLRDDSGTTALHMAVKSRNAQACRLLLEAGADIHVRNALEETPFLLALQYGVDGLALVIDGRTLESADQYGRSPLHIAVSGKPAVEAVTRLIALKADPNTRDMRGDTPLHTALRGAQWEAARLLVKAGADLFARNAQTETPLGIAMKTGRDALGAIIGMDNVNLPDYLGNSPLHIAAQAGDTDAAAFLVSMGADKGLLNLAGETPLQAALKRGNAKTAEILR